ncbi:MAG: VCBS repeat-containing protein [Acidobacteriia bacterium]|nr:VCBS repeat-containing protein [Terriglobia bacterium]
MSRTRLIVSAIFIVILGLIAVPAVWAGGLTPSSASPLATSAKGSAVLLVDLDGDGKLDLVVAEGAPANQVDIYQGNGLGGFTLKQTIGVGANPIALAAGSLTGAANPDIVVANAGSGNITVLQNNGAFGSPFTTLGPYALPGGSPSPLAVAVADMNGDGFPDVIVADGANDQVDILLGNGIPALALTPTASTPYAVGSIPAALVVSDFNGDLEPDVAVANSGGGTVTILTNTTVFPDLLDVTFAAAATSTVGTGPIAIAAGFVGPSGSLDLVVANTLSSDVSVLLNNGAGVFPAAAANTAVSGAPTGIILGDFNSDGKNDIVVSASDGADILFNNGSGVFAPPSVNFPTGGGTNPVAIAVGDVGKPPNLALDGRADVVIADASAAQAFILLGTPFFKMTAVPVSAQEGVAFPPPPTSIFTFQYDNDANPAHFTATVTNWGDGAVSDAENVTCAAPPVCVVDASTTPHTYADPGAEGAKIINLTLTNTTDSQSINATSSATVADAPLSPAATPDLPNAASPHTYTGVTVANFTDANTTAFNTDFSTSIDWGDGSPVDNCAAPCATVTGPQGGPFVVAGTHTYNAVGNFAITTTITDSEATQSPSAPIQVTIHANITSITATPVTFAAIEGKPMANGVTLATFISGRAGAVQGDFSGVVQNWGDGASETETVTGVFPNFSVVTNASAHKYPDEGTFTPVVIGITDNVDSSVATVNSTANVADGLITVTVNGAVTATEGAASIGNIGSFTDENTLTTTAAYTVTIDWGDCGGPCAFVPATNVNGNTGAFTVDDTHTYVEEGSFTVRIKVVDIDSSQTVTGSGAITVNDAPLVVGSLAVLPVTGATCNPPGCATGPGNTLLANVDTWNGTLAAFQDSNTGAPTTDFTIDIAWGDTQTTNCPAPCALVQTNGPAGDFKVVANHMFIKAGTQLTPVTVTVIDKGGAAPLGPTPGTAAVVTSMSNPGPQAITPTEGVAFTNQVVATFTSNRAGAVAGDFNAAGTSVNWGDGNTDNAPSANLSIVSLGGGNFQVQGNHKYAEENPIACGAASCPLGVTVKDNVDGSLLNVNGGTATIADALLTPSAVAGLGPVNEGTALTNVTVLTFTDANTGSPACPGAGCDFTATIDWGDGTAPSVGTVTGNLGGPFTVTGTHTYAEGGLDAAGPFCVAGAPATCQIHVTVNDEGTPSAIPNFNSTSALVNDAPLSNPVGVILTPPGLTVTNVVLGTFHDGNPNATAADFNNAGSTINWGDGNTDTAPSANISFVPLGGGNFQVRGSHTYATLGQLFSVTITVADAGGAAAVVIHSSITTPTTAGAVFNGSASPPQSLIKAGQSVDILITVSPNPNAPPFPNAVQFTGCTILSGPAASGLTCTFNPTSVPDVLNIHQVHMIVQSFAHVAMQTAPPRPGRNGLMQLALLLPAFAGIFGMVLLGSRKSKRRTLLWWGAGFLLLAVLLAGCGGTGLTPPPQGGSGTQPGTYVLQVNTNFGAAVAPCNINGTGPCITATVTVTQ